jgi:hypothetical protein
LNTAESEGGLFQTGDRFALRLLFGTDHHKRDLAIERRLARIGPPRFFDFRRASLGLEVGMIPIGRFSLFLGAAAFLQMALSAAETEVRKQPYHSWGEALVLSNGKVEAVIVPEVGRVMQFRFAGEQDGPFWENRALDGTKSDSQSSEWGNFGGDKSWPAPQADWEKITGRGWPPPAAFDSMPVEAKIEGNALVLKTQVDRHYGIQEVRRIALTRDDAGMIIDTTYQKREGAPMRVSIWVITQLKDPELMMMPLPAKSIFADGYNKQSAKLPLGLELRDGAILCRRSAKDNTKIGSDAGRIFWGDKSHVVEVYSEREKTGEFPDNGSSAEIYTNQDPNAYVELELLGPLQTLRIGESISRRQVYQLHRRNGQPLEKQLRDLARASGKKVAP